MTSDPFAPPPAPRPVRLSELIETDMALSRFYAEREQRPQDPPSLVIAWAIGDDFASVPRGAYAVQLDLN